MHHMEPLASFLDAPADPTTPLRRIGFPTRRTTALALFVCVIVPATLGALQIHRNPMFSPIDEAAHWDYVKRVAGGGIPRMGEKLEPGTLREITCRGTDLHGLEFLDKLCSSARLSPRTFPGTAEQYEAQQPPTYYAITVPIRWFDKSVLGLSDVDATRAAGILWLVVGLLLLWLAGSMIGLQPGTLAAAILAMVSAPLVIYHSAIVSNDAASVFAGSLIAFLTARAITRPGRWTTATLGIGAFFVTFIKTTDGLPVGILSALVFAGVWFRNADKPFKEKVHRWAPTGGALLIGAATAALLWVVINRSIALIEPRDLVTFGVLRGTSVGPDVILREALSLFGPVTDAFASPATLSQNLQQVFATLTKYLLIGVGFSCFFVVPRRWPNVLGLLAFVGLYLGGATFGAGLKLNYDIDPSLAGRYGLAVAPLLVVALAGALKGKWSVRAVWALGLAATAQTFVVMVA
jgi:hypothetical protein